MLNNAKSSYYTDTTFCYYTLNKEYRKRNIEINKDYRPKSKLFEIETQRFNLQNR